MVVLERLTPDQRVAFVLHDGFSVPFSEIASVLGTTDASARQLASRARRIVGQHQGTVDSRHDEVVGRLLAAMANGDMDAVIGLLHPDVTLVGDSNGKARTAIRPIKGADKVARFLFGLARRYGAELVDNQPARARQRPARGVLGGWPGRRGRKEQERNELRPGAAADHGGRVRDGKVYAVWDVANPDKFTGSPLADRPTAPGTRHPS